MLDFLGLYKVNSHTQKFFIWWWWPFCLECIKSIISIVKCQVLTVRMWKESFWKLCYHSFKNLFDSFQKLNSEYCGASLREALDYLGCMKIASTCIIHPLHVGDRQHCDTMHMINICDTVCDTNPSIWWHTHTISHNNVMHYT